MTKLKKFARVIPPPLRSPVRKIWRKFRGNPEFRILKLLADPERLAVDVGANYGVYTVLLARSAKACIAFEPNAAVAAAAKKRVAAEGLTNVQVHACALSNRNGEVAFLVPVVDGVESDAYATIEPENRLSGAEVNRYMVPCHPLDEFGLEAVGLLKIDAEGHETAILDGAKSLIERDKPAVMIEVEERHKSGSVEHVREFFSGLGYRGFFLMGRQILPLHQFKLGTHQSLSSIETGEVLLDRVYVNNFIFAADRQRVARLEQIVRSGRSL